MDHAPGHNRRLPRTASISEYTPLGYLIIRRGGLLHPARWPASSAKGGPDLAPIGWPCKAIGQGLVPSCKLGRPRAREAAMSDQDADAGDEKEERLAGQADLLGEMTALRRRARAARHAYWFPLVLFGLLSCASARVFI